ncbi:MAG: hypothetical protein CMM75_00960 [Rhodospirillaceae bacterium]|jgi:CTP-dependent riboflavin kinase|nr:hypothetical protein [Rhodospirillaceae bacterium]|tara:strand:- start:301 stop:699 length:399 start_codon:yes stop_codon:yes gene_type:complete
MRSEFLTGKIVTGLGKATGFTEIKWVKLAFSELLGCDPFPGTVNVVLSSKKDLKTWKRLKASPEKSLRPPNPDWCNSLCYKAKIGGRINAAIVLPEVKEYPADQLELVASVNVRETLSLEDGDAVEIEIYRN